MKEFTNSTSPLYIGTGYMPVCKECMEEIYRSYESHYMDSKQAIQRMCMAFDMYYDDKLYKLCTEGQKFSFKDYIRKLNMIQYKGKTFESSLNDGFSYFKTFVLKTKEQNLLVPREEDQKRWGAGLEMRDYDALNEHYKYLKDANPDCDSNQEIFINDLCYTKMQQMNAVREGRVDDYKKLTESYIKSFREAGLKTVRETSNAEDFVLGIGIEEIEKYTPAEYYKDKKLFKDTDEIGSYWERFIKRPLKNLILGSKVRDTEFYVKDEESG